MHQTGNLCNPLMKNIIPTPPPPPAQIGYNNVKYFLMSNVASISIQVEKFVTKKSMHALVFSYPKIYLQAL